ncbi:MAG: NAD(P)-binding domain-containing protein [Candidatus Marsarchaeota archaeon]|nr:NAD(P)-binding domain-containing protein [Candidatus Marsarchaeota archaeon]
MRIAFFELEGWEKGPINGRLGRGNQITFISGPLNDGNISQVRDAEVLGLFIYSRLDAKRLAKLPRLKMVATFSTGFDHIDMAECTRRGIVVANVPTYGSHTVAEHTMALMLALAKKIILCAERTRAGDFSIEGLRTFDLADKNLGMIGFGRIGSQAARMARALSMKVWVYDPYADDNLLDLLRCQRAHTLDELLAKADVITLHTPLTPQTEHIINKATIAKMKKGVIIINTARGGLIDTQALVEGLDSGHVGGAGLDVLEEETAIKEERQLAAPEFAASVNMKTLVANHRLLNKHMNVIITPHNAFNSHEALRRILDTSMENIEAYVHGKPANAVNGKELAGKKQKAGAKKKNKR